MKIDQQYVNASIQLVPMDEPANAMPLIDEAIGLLRQSGLHTEVGPFGTSVEGPYEQVMQLVIGLAFSAASPPAATAAIFIR